MNINPSNVRRNQRLPFTDTSRTVNSDPTRQRCPPPRLPVDSCFGYSLVQEEEEEELDCLTGHSLTADVMDGGAEMITGGKQINAGLLRSIFRFKTDLSGPL